MASVVTQPADVVKTNIQISKSRLGTMKAACYIYKVRFSFAFLGSCRGMCTCMLISVRLLSCLWSQERGIGGFFCGAVPRCLRRTLMAAMAWTVYEQLMAQMGLKS